MNDGYMDAAAVPVPDAGDERGPFMHGEGCPDQPTGRLTDQCNCGQREAVNKLLAPDAGDDTLRRAIVTTIGNHTVPIKATLPNGEQTWPASIHILIGESEVAELADALLPRIREHTAKAELRADARARIDEIRQRGRAEAAEAAIERVREQHSRQGSTEQNGFCSYDFFSWPCRTIRALDGSETP